MDWSRIWQKCWFSLLCVYTFVFLGLLPVACKDGTNEFLERHLTRLLCPKKYQTNRESQISNQFRTNPDLGFLFYIYRNWYIGLDSDRRWHYKPIRQL